MLTLALLSLEALMTVLSLVLTLGAGTIGGAGGS